MFRINVNNSRTKFSLVYITVAVYSCHVTYPFQSLAKWLSVRLWTKLHYGDDESYRSVDKTQNCNYNGLDNIIGCSFCLENISKDFAND